MRKKAIQSKIKNSINNKQRIQDGLLHWVTLFSITVAALHPWINCSAFIRIRKTRYKYTFTSNFLDKNARAVRKHHIIVIRGSEESNWKELPRTFQAISTTRFTIVKSSDTSLVLWGDWLITSVNFARPAKETNVARKESNVFETYFEHLQEEHWNKFDYVRFFFKLILVKTKKNADLIKK